MEACQPLTVDGNWILYGHSGWLLYNYYVHCYSRHQATKKCVDELDQRKNLLWVEVGRVSAKVCHGEVVGIALLITEKSSREFQPTNDAMNGDAKRL